MYSNMILENERRNRALRQPNPYMAYAGEKNIDVERCGTDFEYWAAVAVRIRDKRSGRRVPFVLNRAQRRVLRQLESMRTARKPIRIIMLKARQWGGSTLVLIYMAWIQLMHHTDWHSVICAHVKDSARNIRAMFTSLLADYPEVLMGTPGKPYRFAGFERAQNVQVITGRDCRVTIASAECQDSVRGSDIAMAHLSEVAFWKATSARDPEDFLRSVTSSVPLEPDTVIAIESTANGVGNFFHTEWLRAVEGRSDKLPIFVPWYEIDMYSLPVDNYEALIESFTDYERDLWEIHGCTLEQINWYRAKLAEYPKRELMQSEFPTTSLEAFVSSDANVFSNAEIEALRRECRPGTRGELTAKGEFVRSDKGRLTVWEEPCQGASYVTAVDVGGRSEKADWSVIAVLRAGKRPEVVAQWRGHIDHDLLADRAMAISRRYNNALLVIESNTLESADAETVSATVLSRVARLYGNTYRRQRDKLSGASGGIGFHTNRATKSRIIDGLVAALRDGSYVERDNEACNEMATYCLMPNGSYQARRGCHDDILMTRAIALHIISTNCHCTFNSSELTWDPLPTW